MKSKIKTLKLRKAQTYKIDFSDHVKLFLTIIEAIN